MKHIEKNIINSDSENTQKRYYLTLKIYKCEYDIFTTNMTAAEYMGPHVISFRADELTGTSAYQRLLDNAGKIWPCIKQYPDKYRVRLETGNYSIKPNHLVIRYKRDKSDDWDTYKIFIDNIVPSLDNISN